MRWDTTIERPAPKRPPPPTPTVWILHRRQGSVVDPERRELVAGQTPIGRAVGDAGIALEGDPAVSRTHAVLHVERDGPRVRVTDESRHGTLVNGGSVRRAVLSDGDVIRVGDCFLLFRLEPDPAPDAPVPSLIGVAPVVRALRATVALVGPSDATVLLAGESGTGKEVVARALHAARSSSGPFVAVNCSAIPHGLVESQLFGHVAGAFTGARSDHLGSFRAAAGGTLFLDEIGELDPSAQPKLLRVLEERMVTPVGSMSPVRCDVRLVAATNRDLSSAVDAGAFRGDLYARLAEITVALPPLRDRREDVLLLLRHALGAEAVLAPDLVEALLLHDWPFNVRELLKVAKELQVRGAGRDVLALDLVRERLGRRSTAPAPRLVPEPTRTEPHPGPPDPGPDPAAATEPPIPSRAELEALLRKHHGIVADVARVTGRSRKQVYRWIRQHGLELDSHRR